MKVVAFSYLYDKEGAGAAVMVREVAWLDAGTPETLLQAANFVQTVKNGRA